MTAHSNLVPGVLMQSADRKIEQRRVNDGYIDDVDNLADAPSTNRAPECIERLTLTAQIWAAIVMVSGQIMGFHKGGYTMLAFMAVGGYLMHAYRHDFEGEVVLRNAHGKPTTIKYIPPNESNKSLGFLTNCLGEMTDEFKHRLKQAKSFASKTLPARLNLHEAKLALNTRVLPSLTYPFSCTSFTTKQIKTLAIAINNVFLPKMGINRKMKRIAIYAPLEFGGINFPFYK
jgi:hypothetical protein